MGIFSDLKKNNEMALVSFWPMGFPTLASSLKAMKALEKAGSDIIEVGIPFTDPIADGPVIQEASNRAIAKGITPLKALDAIGKMKLKKPVMILTYYNVIFKMGVEKFVSRAKAAGVQAILAADLPIEEAGPLEKACEEKKVKTVFTIAPNTSEERIREIARHTTAFLYLMAHYGVTGAKDEVEATTLTAIGKAKDSAPETPVCVGFGISKKQHVELMKKTGADGAIVGSAFVKLAMQEKNEAKWLAKVEKLARELKQATK